MMASRLSPTLLSGSDRACMGTPWPLLDARIDRHEVEALVKDDPYFTNGLVLGLHWRLSFCRTRRTTHQQRIFQFLRDSFRQKGNKRGLAFGLSRLSNSDSCSGLSRSPPTSFVIGTSCWDLPCDEPSQSDISCEEEKIRKALMRWLRA